MLKNSLHKKVALGALAIIATLTFCITCTYSAQAWGNAGNGGNMGATNGTNCSTQRLGSCHGGGWTWHATNSNSITIRGMSGTGYSFPGGTITGCKKVGGYFVSSWFYNGDSDNLVGIAANNTWAGQGGWHTYNTAAGAMPIGEVEAAFITARDVDKVVPAGVTWNTVGWFCSKQPPGGCPEDHPYYPTCEPPEPEPEYGDAEFYSQSTVEVFDPEISGGHKETTDRNGQVKVYFSVNEYTTHAEVEFSHLVGYDNGSNTKLTSGDTADDGTVFTKWKVTGAYTVAKTKWGDVTPWEGHTTSPSEAKQRVSFDWAEDEYGDKEKCSTITYNHRSVGLTKTPVYECDEYSCWIDHYEWSAGYGDTGSSSVCAVVTRPKPPEDDPGPTTPNGDVDSKVMFAGETTKLRWVGIKGIGVPTRRLRDERSIKFVVDEIPGFDSNKLAKVPTTKLDPCQLYNQRFGTNSKYCGIHVQTEHDTSEQSTVGEKYEFPYSPEEEDFKVPNEVGYKYCNSFGYKFEYWYGVLRGDNEEVLSEDDINWVHDEPKDYWYDFHASCRTVAKKPSLSVWNGSLLAGGNIITSLARRFNSVGYGENAVGDRTMYGSWAEYLIATNATLDSDRTMGSASSLSKGSSDLKICNTGDVWKTNSAMTIANSSLGGSECSLQPSGITSNSTFRTRLNAYLKDVSGNPNIKTTSNVADLYGGVTGNTVVNVSGDLTITNDIKINDSTEYTLHDVPQAVIFVSGNVKITENVSRVDAWIIAPNGKIETCTSFANKATTGDSVVSAGNNCTKQLVFNGPVIARNVDLRRSYGSDPTITHAGKYGTFGTVSDKQSSAEVFNLRGDTYLWAYAQAARYNSSYNEVYSRELAPRY